MSNSTNIKAILLRVNSEHKVRCSAAQERKLVSDLERLWSDRELSRKSVGEVVSDLPAIFFTENKLDSARQYSGLLWDALSVDVKELQTSSSTSIVNFNGNVQTQILQTGANSKAQINQESQQNQAYSKAMGAALKEVRDVIDVEILDAEKKKDALAIVSSAEQENSKANPDKGKIQKFLGSFGKWTGERFTKAVDTAIEVGVKYGFGSGGS